MNKIFSSIVFNMLSVIYVVYAVNAETIIDPRGSGFIIHPDGYILTNDHVINGTTNLLIFLTDSSVYQAKVVETDPYKDIALLKIAGKNLPIVPLGDSRIMKEMDSIMAVGYPLSRIIGSGASGYEGEISNTRRQIKKDQVIPWFQISADLNPGNSGGPVVNEQGEAIGIAVAGLNPIFVNNQLVHVPQGINFAIPIYHAQSLLLHAYPDGIQWGTGKTAKRQPQEIFERVSKATVYIATNKTVESKPVDVAPAYSLDRSWLLRLHNHDAECRIKADMTGEGGFSGKCICNKWNNNHAIFSNKNGDGYEGMSDENERWFDQRTLIGTITNDRNVQFTIMNYGEKFGTTIELQGNLSENKSMIQGTYTITLFELYKSLGGEATEKGIFSMW